MPDDPQFRPLGPGDLGWIVERHGTAYARDEGFDGSFEILVARVVADFAESHDPAREAGWIVARDGQRLGSIFCVAEDAVTARLRLVYLEPEERGRGLGRRMLDHAMAFARDAGFRRMVVSTHESHRAAGALYRRAGFALTGSWPARSFGRDVVVQTFETDL